MSKVKKLWKKVKGGLIFLSISEILVMLIKNGGPKLVAHWFMIGVGLGFAGIGAGFIGAGISGLRHDARMEEVAYEQTEEAL